MAMKTYLAIRANLEFATTLTLTATTVPNNAVREISAEIFYENF